MKHTLEQAMKRNGLETEIRNIVFHLIRTSVKNDVKMSIQTVCKNFPFSFKSEKDFSFPRMIH